MMNVSPRSLVVLSSTAALVCVGALVTSPGCDASKSAVVDVGGTGGSSTSGAGGSLIGAGGASVADAGTTTGSDAAAGGGSLCGAVTLAETLTVPAGMTQTICAGSTLTAAKAGVSVTVLGTLAVVGTASSPVKLVGASADPGSWTGLVLEAGGQLTASYLELHGAVTGIAARPGSTYSIDHIVIDTSLAMLVLSSNGTIDHGTLRGLGDAQSSIPILVSNASPRITNTAVTQGLYQGVDMIVVGGTASAPLFDHVEVADSHCAFHFDTSTGATISNSFVHHNAYGFMVIGSTAGQVLHNNFEDNDVNIGSCGLAASLVVAANYFAGEPFGDGSCATLSVTGTPPPGPYTTGIGPTP